MCSKVTVFNVFSWKTNKVIWKEYLVNLKKRLKHSNLVNEVWAWEGWSQKFEGTWSIYNFGLILKPLIVHNTFHLHFHFVTHHMNSHAFKHLGNNSVLLGSNVCRCYFRSLYIIESSLSKASLMMTCRLNGYMSIEKGWNRKKSSRRSFSIALIIKSFSRRRNSTSGPSIILFWRNLRGFSVIYYNLWQSLGKLHC